MFDIPVYTICRTFRRLYDSLWLTELTASDGELSLTDGEFPANGWTTGSGTSCSISDFLQSGKFVSSSIFAKAVESAFPMVNADAIRAVLTSRDYGTTLLPGQNPHDALEFVVPLPAGQEFRLAVTDRHVLAYHGARDSAAARDILSVPVIALKKSEFTGPRTEHVRDLIKTFLRRNASDLFAELKGLPKDSD